jgi:hypothetical protein
MLLSQLLRRISWLALVPGAVTYVITMVGAQVHSTNLIVEWSTKWWWFVLIVGTLIFFLLRSVAALLNKIGGI